MIPLSQFGTLFVAVLALLMVVLPRKWAAAPLFVGVCYMVLSQGIAIGGFNFFVIRILVFVGVVRVLIRRERLTGRMNSMDWLMIAWAAWALAAAVFRDNPSETLTYNMGLVYNACGVYFLLRVLVTSSEDAKRLCCVVSILLIPIALEMIREQLTAHNLFSVLGGVTEEVAFREGRLRAQGPFAHPILAGTVGAVFLPIAIALWRFHRKTAIAGSLACCAIVYASSSSGPLMSAIFAVLSLAAWRFRHHMKALRWGVVLAYLGLSVVMKAPVYFLLARIDLTGGSTGWHRAQLIDSGLHHLSEWWLAGTDYTRHWMPTGVSWSPNHTDITNHYLGLGVDGGLLLLALFVAMICVGFSMVGGAVRHSEGSSEGWDRFYWALGASLFAHAATMISVSYFDQSFAFIYLTLAAISGCQGDASQAVSDSASTSTSHQEPPRAALRLPRGGMQPRHARARRQSMTLR